MKATAELQVVPIGSGVSVRQEITRVVELLQGHDFIVETHASGTNIEGELADILAVVAEIHESLHADGSIRRHSPANACSSPQPATRVRKTCSRSAQP